MKPGNIVGAIANEAELESKYIGEIEIRDDYSTVDLPADMPNEVMAVLKKTRVAGRPLSIAVYKSKPKQSNKEQSHKKQSHKKKKSQESVEKPVEGKAKKSYKSRKSKASSEKGKKRKATSDYAKKKRDERRKK